MPDTGWKKEFPSVNGWYWSRRTGPRQPLHVRDGSVAYGSVWMTPAINPLFFENREWLGPISPSDFERLVRLREVAEEALEVLDLAEAAMSAAAPYCAGDLEVALNERARKARAIANDLRAALETSHDRH